MKGDEGAFESVNASCARKKFYSTRTYLRLTRTFTSHANSPQPVPSGVVRLVLITMLCKSRSCLCKSRDALAPTGSDRSFLCGVRWPTQAAIACFLRPLVVAHVKAWVSGGAFELTRQKFANVKGDWGAGPAFG